MSMTSSSIDAAPEAAGQGAVSDTALRLIAEQGFFGVPGSLANARSACAELIFARAMIKAQTAALQVRSSGG